VMATEGKGKAGIILAIVGGVAIIGIGLMMRKRKQQQAASQSSFEEGFGGSVGGRGVTSQEARTGRTSRRLDPTRNVQSPTYEILTNIESPALREYISSILDTQQAEKLQGWMSLIANQRSQDSSKWAISEGFSTMNGSDVAHSLYQMDRNGRFNWNTDVRARIIELE
jgi:hypothetical protein